MFHRYALHRTGGDEFVSVCKSGCASYVSLSQFYGAFKSEINALVKRKKYKPIQSGLDALRAGQQTMKERKKKRIKTELGGAMNKLAKGVWKGIERAIDEDTVEFSLDTIGVSTGLFVPNYGTVSENEWIKRADEALDWAKTEYAPKKNSIGIFYEGKGMVSAEKTKQCLRRGCHWVLDY